MRKFILQRDKNVGNVDGLAILRGVVQQIKRSIKFKKSLTRNLKAVVKLGGLGSKGESRMW